MTERGTLLEGEPHPSAKYAMEKVILRGYEENVKLLGALSSCAIEGNRTAEIVCETLRRVLSNEPVSDRYILGLFDFITDLDKDFLND